MMTVPRTQSHERVEPPGRRGGRFVAPVVIGVTAVLVVAALLYANRSESQAAGRATVSSGTGGGRLGVGALAPDFSAPLVGGGDISLSALRGKPVWLTFGASWCAECRTEAPDVQAAHLRYQAAGLVVLGVYVDEDEDAVTGYASRVGITYPQVADPNHQIAEAYRVVGVPAHFFIDRTGVLHASRDGALSPDLMDAELTEITR
jgi:peroxiredoxin